MAAVNSLPRRVCMVQLAIAVQALLWAAWPLSGGAQTHPAALSQSGPRGASEPVAHPRAMNSQDAAALLGKLEYHAMYYQQQLSHEARNANPRSRSYLYRQRISICLEFADCAERCTRRSDLARRPDESRHAHDASFECSGQPVAASEMLERATQGLAALRDSASAALGADKQERLACAFGRLELAPLPPDCEQRAALAAARAAYLTHQEVIDSRQRNDADSTLCSEFADCGRDCQSFLSTFTNASSGFAKAIARKDPGCRVPAALLEDRPTRSDKAKVTGWGALRLRRWLATVATRADGDTASLLRCALRALGQAGKQTTKCRFAASNPSWL